MLMKNFLLLHFFDEKVSKSEKRLQVLFITHKPKLKLPD